MSELLKTDMKGKVILSAHLPALDMDVSYLILKAQAREVGYFLNDQWFILPTFDMHMGSSVYNCN